MALVHGKHAVVRVGEIAIPCTTSQLERTADTHDVTLSGPDTESHRFHGGLVNGTFTASGVYDNTASTGSAAVLDPLVGQTVQIEWQPDSTGVGKAQRAFDAILTKYTETAPVADMVTWSADLQVSGDVDSTAQAA